MKYTPVDDEEVIQKIDALMKDPQKWREYIESHAERALKHWRKKWTRSNRIPSFKGSGR